MRTLLMTFLAAAVLAGLPGAPAAAQSLTTLYSFQPAVDGALPNGIVLANGSWYGTAFLGGPANDGTFFKFNEDSGALTVLHNFGSPDGIYPTGDLLRTGNTLYGVTEQCGCAGSEVFSLDVKNDKYASVSLTSQGYLNGPLAILNGVLYGTSFTSALGYGSVFSLNPATQQFSVIYNFSDAASGKVPAPGLVNINGIFYGATHAGGVNGRGVLFSINPSTGAEASIYNFPFGNEGGPVAPLISVKKILYGETASAAKRRIDPGTVFSFDTASAKFKTLHKFHGAPDGSYPGGLVYVSGTLYGAAQEGGSAGCGTIFQIDPKTGAETTLHSFLGGTEGCVPEGALVYNGGSLYGATGGGGTSNSGTIFKFTP